VERFWRFVSKTDGCWLWVGRSGTKKGYGLIQEGGKGTPRKLAHRLSYEIHHGPIPDGMVVMHSCDNPSCVNPAHLRVGTAAENIKEAYDKRRKVSPFKKGEAHHGAVLDAEKVRFIRNNPHLSCGKLAKQYGVGVSAISAIRRRETWAHIE
jgi:hypothetical protein